MEGEITCNDTPIPVLVFIQFESRATHKLGFITYPFFHFLGKLYFTLQALTAIKPSASSQA